MKRIRFPKSRVKTYLSRSSNNLVITHQFDPFPYIISKRNASSSRCTYCDMYSIPELRNSPISNYGAVKPSRFNSNYCSSESSLEYLNCLLEELKGYPHIQQLLQQLFEFRSYSNVIECCHDLNVNIYLDVIQDEYRLVLDTYYANHLKLVTLLKNIYLALNAVSDFLIDAPKTLTLLSILTSNYSNYNWSNFQSSYCKSLYRCSGSNEFVSKPCPKNFIFGTTDTIYQSSVLFFITNYSIKDSYFLGDKSYIFEFDTSSNLVKPPNINNVYSSGEICFGSVEVTDCADRFNAFWSSHFNNDLNNTKNNYTAQEFFKYYLENAEDVSQFSSITASFKSIIYEE